MLPLRYILHKQVIPHDCEIIPVIGVLTGIIVPLAVFVWLYHEEKGVREAIIEIAKHLDDPAKAEQLLGLFDERKKAPIDYRRGGEHAVCRRGYLSTWRSILQFF